MGEERQRHLYTQLADFFIQLEQQKFDKIGALSLKHDGVDSPWIFGTNRPLSMCFNQDELAGFDVSSLLGPEHTFDRTFDYVHNLMEMVFNNFWKSTNIPEDDNRAMCGLYRIYMCRDYLMEWIDITRNKGPFILMHGDFRPPNITIDNIEEVNIISVVDREWSHIVPAQMFCPPTWLTRVSISTRLAIG